MDEVNALFPEPEKTDDPIDIFPSLNVENYPLASEAFKANLAERYAIKNDKPYSEVRSDIELNGPQSVPLATPLEDNSGDLLNRAVYNQLSPEEFLNMHSEYRQEQQDILDSGVSRDSVEAIYSAKNLQAYSLDKRQAVVFKIFQDAYVARTPDKGVLGTIFDFAGHVLRESTYGVLEKGMGTGEKEAYDDYMKAMGSGSIADVVKIANESAAKSAEKGLLGDNIFANRMDLQARLLGGQGMGEQYNFIFDAATLIPFATIGKIAKIGSTAKAIPLAVDAIDMVAATKGLNAADGALSKALQEGAESAELVRHTASIDNKVAAPSTLSQISPSKIPVDSYEEFSKAKNYISKIFFGVDLTTEELEAGAKSYGESRAKSLNQDFRGSEIVEMGTGNYEVGILLGRPDGGVYTSTIKANQVAKKLNGEVIELGEDQFVIRVQEALPLKGLSKATLPSELESGIIRNWLSPDTTTSLENLANLKVGLDKGGAIQENIVKPFTKALGKLGKFNGEKKTFNSIILDYHESYMDTTPSLQKFATDWYERTGSQAPAHVLEAYEKTAEYGYAVHFMEADKIKKYYDNVGIRGVSFKGDAQKYHAQPIKDIADEFVLPSGDTVPELVYDVSKGRLITAAEAKDTSKQIYRLHTKKELDGKFVEYITGEVTNSSPLYHNDIIPPRPFGPRRTNAKYFIRQDSTATTVSGKSVDVAPKLVFGARSLKEAQKALEEMTLVMKKLSKEVGYSLRKESNASKFKTKADIKAALKGDNAALNEFIAKTITFDNSIENVDDFLKMMDDTGLKFGDMKVVSNSEKIEVNASFDPSITSNSTHADLYRAQHSVVENRYKTVKPDGFETFRTDPIVSMQRDFTRGVNDFQTRNYLKRSSEGLIKGGRKHITNYKAIKDLPLSQQVREAVFSTSTKEGQKFAQEQTTILRSLSEKSQFAKHWELTMNKVQDYVFDKTGKQLSMFDWLSKDPVVALRGFAYHLKMGLFNPDQLIVQSSQALNIMAISPKYGLSAALMYTPIRAALLKNDDAFLKVLASRASKVSGMSEEDTFHLIEYFKKSGRGKVGKEIPEYSGAEDFSYGSLQKGLEAGTVFFKEGELVPRIMATVVAFREFKTNPQFRTINLNTKKGMEIMETYVTKRAHTLTANMGSASAAVWQKGVPSLMFQWQGYLARSMEQIFIGRDLSRAERFRLASSQLAFYGLTGWGIGGILDKVLADNPEGMDPDQYTLIKYGAIDYLLGEILDERTAYSTRLSSGSGLYDAFEKINEESFLTVAGGPAIGLAGDFVTQSFQTMYSLVTGKNHIAAFNLDKLAKHASSYNKISKSLLMYRTGEFKTISGMTVVNNMSGTAAALNIFGAPFQEVISKFDADSMVKASDQLVFDTYKAYSELNEAAFKMAREGDSVGADAVHAEALDLLVPLTPIEQSKVLRKYKPKATDGFTDTMMRVKRVGLPGVYEQMRLMREKGTN